MLLQRNNRSLLLIIALLLLSIASPQWVALAQSDDAPQVYIATPRSGEPLQGVVKITGATETVGFQAAEVSFAYQSDATGTWFLINQRDEAVLEGELASWDTTTISDGEYRLRLQVFLNDGQVLESHLENLRVRNYTPVETPTSASVTQTIEEAQPPLAALPRTATPLEDFRVEASTPQALPTNPAQVTREHLQRSALQGIMIVFGAAFAAFIYIGIKRIAQR